MICVTSEQILLFKEEIPHLVRVLHIGMSFYFGTSTATTCQLTKTPDCKYEELWVLTTRR